MAWRRFILVHPWFAAARARLVVWRDGSAAPPAHRQENALTDTVVPQTTHPWSSKASLIGSFTDMSSPQSGQWNRRLPPPLIVYSRTVTSDI
jgi:hypothetical protein